MRAAVPARPPGVGEQLDVGAGDLQVVVLDRDRGDDGVDQRPPT
jgi:hypothetical protein